MATILFQLSSLAFAPALPRLFPALPAIHTRAAPINQAKAQQTSEMQQNEIVELHARVRELAKQLFHVMSPGRAPQSDMEILSDWQ